jgi:hypothetical protein
LKYQNKGLAKHDGKKKVQTISKKSFEGGLLERENGKLRSEIMLRNYS